MTENAKARKKELDLLEKEADVRKAQAEARKAELELDDMEHTYNWASANKSSRTGTFLFDEEVNASNCAFFLEHVRRWHRTHPGEPIEIILNTPGGSVFAGLGVYDELRTLSEVHGHEITVRVRGYAASFGVILLQAGDKRYIGAESLLMVHELSTMTWGKFHELKNEVEFAEKLNKRLFEILARRTGGKYTATKLYREAKAKDLWISAEEAVTKYGLADSIG